ncbi:deoxyhypusine synthase [Candidatus Pacearchaeota archaeon CG_4_9_14_0_2_um_filter_39_13]|nr:deoxyhypusine synthase [Candidatus Pacearchaeota archaeon]OIO43865.1 MAG: deoxyhypusine synthase [Candidatus Pacearchaeota archaeon CG1_02_39_14]PJC44714.1 MAG: deoxyhypusine synthase [Candidatus Pacearchaeota archaeon CG_4_9_14_0_2_um_filter_39_13]
MDEANENEKSARENLLRSAAEINGIRIEGYDFDKGVDYSKIIESFASSGAQASEFSKAIDVVNDMIKDDAFIFLGYTSNMISSGNRDIIRWLVKHNKVNALVTTAGGIEEDFIKCLGDFYLGDFRASGKELREKGVNRIGNIFVSNNRYVEFEKWIQPILEELYQESKGKAIIPSELILKLGEKINDERSIYYWAWKNKIPVYCPAITDGALGDNVYFFKFKRDDFVLDIAEDVKRFNDLTIGLKKSGAIVLGAGVVKHAVLNANMLRNGLDYSVYINTALEFDASDSGALPEEAVSWGKIRKNAKSMKVFGDATILFPILVAESFARNQAAG